MWYAIFSPVYCFFNRCRIDYALTNKSLYCTSELIGVDIASAELPEVQSLRVDVGALGAMFKRGTIRFGARNALCYVENRRNGQNGC